ncbi:hypothetical protein MYXA107069_20950 [Myxococcus xanthus]|nr:hypothetical protein MyxoNM_27910 [Myxococcus xanthus]SDY06557.1 hypothetical protein SAMN05444383_117167 [Myxococcus xanthus]
MCEVGPVSGLPRPLCTLPPPQQGPHPSYAFYLGTSEVQRMVIARETFTLLG